MRRVARKIQDTEKGTSAAGTHAGSAPRKLSTTGHCLGIYDFNMMTHLNLCDTTFLQYSFLSASIGLYSTKIVFLECGYSSPQCGYRLLPFYHVFMYSCSGTKDGVSIVCYSMDIDMLVCEYGHTWCGYGYM